jgi:hypothetical protein
MGRSDQRPAAAKEDGDDRAGSGARTGIFQGWLLTLVYAAAAISRAQQRLQRKVRHWQTESAWTREEASQVAKRDHGQARDGGREGSAGHVGANSRSQLPRCQSRSSSVIG